MKLLRYLIFCLLLTAMFARAQTNFQFGRLVAPSVIQTLTSSNAQPNGGSVPLTNAPALGYAEAITPDIQALATGLQNDPVKIFNYVHDHIQFVPYFGSEKGAELTLLEQ